MLPTFLFVLCFPTYTLLSLLNSFILLPKKFKDFNLLIGVRGMVLTPLLAVLLARMLMPEETSDPLIKAWKTSSSKRGREMGVRKWFQPPPPSHTRHFFCKHKLARNKWRTIFVETKTRHGEEVKERKWRNCLKLEETRVKHT